MKPPLWAPWRMEYILAPKDKTRCVFCDAAAAEDNQLRERRVLVVAAHGSVLLNTFPFNASHLLMIPHKHVSDIEQLTDEEHAGLWDLTRKAVLCLRRAVQPQGINLGMNLGPVAGAGIADHAHVHLVPRWLGDTNFMPVLADVHVMPQHLDDTWLHLYPHFSNIPGRRAPAPR
jgi:ATP adenylyltransferase